MIDEQQIVTFGSSDVMSEKAMSRTDGRLLSQLETSLPAESLVSDEVDMRRFTSGARYGEGRAALVVRPRTTRELQDVIIGAITEGITIIPQSGNTGLVGASIPNMSGKQIVVSLDRMRTPPEIDLYNRTATVSAGTRLSELNTALLPHNLQFPIDLGADPMIGGMIATNTGGARLIRYGDVRANVLGLELVLADRQATVLDLLTPVRKNNAGPDLKHLFIGTGGAFGIITRAILNLARKPKSICTALLAPAAWTLIPALIVAIEDLFDHQISAIEGLSGATLQLVAQNIPGIRNPFAPDPTPDYAILLELSGADSDATTLNQHLETGLAKLFDEALITNAVIGKPDDLWRIRHSISEALKEVGKIVAFDISVPRGAFAEFRQGASVLVKHILPEAIIVDFGHIGDGGLHFNLVIPSQHVGAAEAERIERFRDEFYAFVISMRGSFSAEHGLGPYNWRFYEKYRSPSLREIDARLSGFLATEKHFSRLPFAVSTHDSPSSLA